MLYKFGSICAILAAIVISLSANAGVPVGSANFLSADFDSRTPGDPLGQGGAQAGEPTDLSSLDGVIVEQTPGNNFLRVNNNSSNTFASSLRWDLLDNAEISSGQVQISFRFKPLALERYNLGVRESGGSARTFLQITFSTDGTFSASDAAGIIPLTNATYAANTELAFVIDFDMDARTSEMTVNGLPVFSGRLHGILDRGVGRVLTGYSSSNAGNSFELDDLTVNGEVPLPLVLDADFDDKTLAGPIDTGGAEVGEPATISDGLLTEIIDPTLSNPILQLQNTTAGLARAMRWQFLDDIEIDSGLVAFDVDLEFAVRDNYQVLIRESGSSGSNFATLRFFTAGNITLADSNAVAASLPALSYNAGQLYRLRMIYNIDAGTYSVLLDNTELVVDRAHGVSNGRGVGSIIFAFQSNASAAAEFSIDALQVGASDAAIIPSQLNLLVEPTSGLVNKPLLPALEVSVVNVFDQLLANSVMVEAGIENGPGGATLSGAIESTVAGTARFENLQVDVAGLYRLRARAGRATITSDVDITVEMPPNEVFEDGFEQVIPPIQ